MRYFLALAFMMAFPSFAQQSENVTLRGHMNLNEMSLNPSSGSDIWGITDPNGREYAIMTVNNGTVVVDMTDPANLVEVGAVPGNSSSWRDVKTYVYDNTPGNFSAYAFVTTEANQGLQIIDLSDLPNSISLAATYTGFSSAHNIYIDPQATEPYAYILGSNLANGGVLVLDIADPLNPVIVGQWSDFYVHDFYLGNYWADSNYDGQDIGVAFCGSQNMSIIDFSDKTNPTTIEDYSYPTLAYCHAGWVDKTGRYVYVNDEFDEGQLGQNTTIYVVDIGDMANPSLAHTWIGPTAATDHNAFVKDDYLHVSNYRRGYTILDISDPVAPEELGYYDTYPSSNSSNTSGAWGAYPWYDSGLVSISDIQTGLYIMEPAIGPSFSVAANETSVAVCTGGNAQVTVNTSANSLFSGDITLAAEDVPVGMTVDFGTNPVTPGSSSTVTVTTTGMAAGSYGFTVRGTGAGAQDRTLEIRVHVSDGPDGAPLLTSPVDGDGCMGTVNIPLVWQSAGFGREYRVQVATDQNFNQIIVDETTNQTGFVIPGPLDADTNHFWRVRSDNACTTGSFGAAFSFNTATRPVLLVDDDNGSIDVRSHYTNVLDTMDVVYDIYDTQGGNGPTFNELTSYQWVIWFSGASLSSSGPSSADEGHLTNFLINGGNLFISAQDYIWARNTTVTPFMTNYLGIASAGNDSGNYTSVDGAGPLASLGTLSLNPYMGQDFSDRLDPTAEGETVLVGNNSNSAAVKTQNTFFAGFVYATAINNSNGEAAELVQFLQEDFGVTDCNVELSACVVYDRAGDGFDMGDFLARTEQWGADEDLLSLIGLTSCLAVP